MKVIKLQLIEDEIEKDSFKKCIENFNLRDSSKLTFIFQFIDRSSLCGRIFHFPLFFFLFRYCWSRVGFETFNWFPQGFTIKLPYLYFSILIMFRVLYFKFNHHEKLQSIFVQEIENAISVNNSRECATRQGPRKLWKLF